MITVICVLAPIHGIRWMVDYANSEIPNTNRESLVCDEKDRVPTLFESGTARDRDQRIDLPRIKEDGFMGWR